MLEYFLFSHKTVILLSNKQHYVRYFLLIVVFPQGSNSRFCTSSPGFLFFVKFDIAETINTSTKAQCSALGTFNSC